MNKVTAGIIVLGAVFFSTAAAQEEARPSLARQKVIPPLPTDANVKVGPILLRFTATLRSEFVDNVNLSNGKVAPIESDFILYPQLGIDAAWPITKLNVLRFHTTVGITKYFRHPELGTNDLLVSPDSELRFDIYTGDFRINLHDQFSLQEDPVGQGTLSNVSKFGRFTNSVGLGVLWDLNDVVLTAGYDHSDFIVTGTTTAVNPASPTQNTSALNRATEQISASAVFNLDPAVSAGLESNASLSSYADAPQNDATRVSAGPFAQLLLSRYTRVYASAGYQGTFFDQPARTPAAATTAGPNGLQLLPPPASASAHPNSFYLNFSIAHRLNRYYQDRLSIGHDSQLGLFSQSTETTYVNYASGFQLSPVLLLSTAIFLEDTVESGAQSSAPFKRFGCTLSTGYRITKKLSASFFYQYIQKISDSDTQDYRQNRVGLGLSYQF